MDEGANANLTYEITSGNDLQHFTIDMHSGELLVARALNYEETTSYNITLQASDGGAVPLTATTLVHIIVTDANDNDPMFLQPLYSKSIEENATIFHVIVTVTATDRDSGANAVIEYSILEAANSPEIKINSTTGEIFIVSSLDFESRREFDLNVVATDMGVEQRTGSASVIITVLDINDNEPQFMPVNVTATVRENSSPGEILSLIVEDADTVSDFKYYIVSGNNGGQFTLDEDTGVLRSNVTFDREEQDIYLLVVTAEDNGSPPLTGTGYVTIEIIDVDDSRPSNAQTNVFIYRYQGNVFPQVLGTIYIEDPDASNSYSYRVLDGSSDVFTISNGMIFYPNTPPDAGEYTSLVEVDDNGLTAISTVTIVVVDVIEDMLREAVFLQLVEVDDVTFAHENYIKLQQAIASRLGVDPRMVHLFGLQPSVNRTGCLDVQIAVQTPSDGFLQRRKLEHFLHKFRRVIMVEAGVEIFTERADLCASEPCGDKGECSNVVEFTDKNLRVSDDNGLSVILLGVHRTHQYLCNCLPGYSGNTCGDSMFDFCHSNPCPQFANCSNTQDGHVCTCPSGTILNGDSCTAVDCESLNCINGGSCVVTSSGLKCTCPPSFVGGSCEIPLNVADICANDKPCDQGNCTFSHVGYTCTCPLGFTGSNCGITTTTNNGGCFQNPCQYGATCEPVGSDGSFNCVCPSGYTGKHCENFLYAMEDEGATDEPVSCQADSCSANEQCVISDNLLLCAADDCVSSPCLNGGSCFPQYPGYYCFCPFGHDGPRCEATEASFTGTSYAVFPSALQQQLSGNVHLEFVTLNTSGLLLYTGRFDNQYHDVMILQLVNSMLQLIVSYGGSMTILSSDVALNDGLWHEIDIQHNSTVSIYSCPIK